MPRVVRYKDAPIAVAFWKSTINPTAAPTNDGGIYSSAVACLLKRHGTASLSVASEDAMTTSQGGKEYVNR